jgi:hypothetical protein
MALRLTPEEPGWLEMVTRDAEPFARIRQGEWLVVDALAGAVRRGLGGPAVPAVDEEG